MHFRVGPVLPISSDAEIISEDSESLMGSEIIPWFRVRCCLGLVRCTPAAAMTKCGWTLAGTPQETLVPRTLVSFQFL